MVGVHRNPTVVNFAQCLACADMKIRWWRIAALSLVTITALVGAILAFTSKPPPSRDATVSRLSPVSPGARLGDLQGLVAATPIPTAEPTADAPARTTRTQAPRTSRSAPKPSGNPFKKIPGGGILQDLCASGKC